MNRNFHEFHPEPEVTRSSERSTAFVLTGALLLVGGINYRSFAVLLISLILASTFAVLGLLRPSTLRPLNGAWFHLGRLLHKISNPIIMGILFFGVILPFGLVMRLFKDPMGARRGDVGSYWIIQKPDVLGQRLRSMRDQF